MIKIIKTNKKKIIIACILIIAIPLLIISITLFIIFFIDGLQNNAVDKKAMQYENERKRLEYFLENEEYLNELANYFTEYPVLDRIGKNIWCSNVDEPAYELNNITICMYEESSDLPLEDIVELYKKQYILYSVTTGGGALHKRKGKQNDDRNSRSNDYYDYS